MAGEITYHDPSRLEDVLDIIINVSPDSTPLGTMLGKTTARQTLHEWLEYSASRSTDAAPIYEGEDITYVDLTRPARRVNATAIIQKPVKVSDTQRAVAHAGTDDMFEKQTSWEMTNWKLAQEWAIVNGAFASGASGVDRAMAGLINVITTIATQYSSGASFGRDDFMELQKLSYETVGKENLFDMVLVPARLKRRISSFASDDQGNQFYAMEDKRLVDAINVIEADFGVVRIFPHLDVPSAAATEHLLGIKEDMYKIAYLRKPKVERMPKPGDSTAGRIIGELTLEYLAERTSVRALTHHGI